MATGGAEAFTTNVHLSSTQPPSTTQPKCPTHNQREVDYYCNNCNIGLCSKCILEQHQEHERLDIECDETRKKAIEELERLQNIIQNRIKDLEKTRSTLLESFEKMKSLCEDSCTKVTEKTEQIVSDLRKGCKKITKDIRNNLEENRKKVEERETEITSEIKFLEGNTKSNISPSSKTTLNILQTLHRLLEIVKQEAKDYNLCFQYLQWVGKRNVSLDIDEIGSVISKSFYTPGSYQFIFDINDVQKHIPYFWKYIFFGEKERSVYYSKNKYRSMDLVWSCCVERSRIGDYLCIYIKLFPDDKPTLDDYIFIDGTISVLNIDDSKTITESFSNERLYINRIFWRRDWRFNRWGRAFPITWRELTGKNKGYLNCHNQFVVQFNITDMRTFIRR